MAGALEVGDLFPTQPLPIKRYNMRQKQKTPTERLELSTLRSLLSVKVSRADQLCQA